MPLASAGTTLRCALVIAALAIFPLAADAQGLGGLGGLGGAGGLPDVRLPLPLNQPLGPAMRPLERATGTLSGVVDAAVATGIA